MSASSSSSVQAARQALGDRLRELREDRRLTKTQHAESCGWSRSKTSRIEAALTQPTPQDIETWCHVCGVAGEAPNLVASLRALTSMFVQWRRMERTGLKRAQESVLPLYERTRVFRVYSSNILPGMLQTRAYTTTLLRATQRRRVTVDDVEAAVDVRMARQRILHEGRGTFAFLVEESVLYDCLGPTRVQAEQLEALITVGALPNVSLGIVPKRTDRTWMPVETFCLFDSAEAAVELVSGHLTITAPDEVAAYEHEFTVMASMAAYGAQARSLIAKAITALR